MHLTLATTILVCYFSSFMFFPLLKYVQNILLQDARSLAHRDPYNWIILVIMVYGHLINECLVVCSLIQKVCQEIFNCYEEISCKSVLNISNSEKLIQRLILLVNQWWPWDSGLIIMLCILVRFMVMILLASFVKLIGII